MEWIDFNNNFLSLLILKWIPNVPKYQSTENIAKKKKWSQKKKIIVFVTYSLFIKQKNKKKKKKKKKASC
jgi:hypothetical protein